MSFFDRYTSLCKMHELQPHSQRAADLFGVSRATISAWGKGSVPKGETLSLIADYFHVSVDYLICRTDDPTDYTSGAPGPHATPVPAGAQATPRILTLWQQLDPVDQIRVEAYAEGILTSDKYRLQQAKKTG